MKKTKIVCTMGPNTDNREIMKELALNGRMSHVLTFRMAILRSINIV